MCERENGPGSGSCVHCGFPSVASAVEVAKARGEPNPIPEGYATVGKATGKGIAWFIALFLPASW